MDDKAKIATIVFIAMQGIPVVFLAVAYVLEPLGIPLMVVLALIYTVIAKNLVRIMALVFGMIGTAVFAVRLGGYTNLALEIIVHFLFFYMSAVAIAVVAEATKTEKQEDTSKTLE